MKRALATVGVLGLVVLGSVLLSSPAQATDGNIPVASDCNTGWYVNHDEENLLPEQTKDGMLLDGPSLFKRATNGLLNTMPQDGAFEAVVETGVKPLFKVETLNPYSTVNKTADGKYWSSKIPSGTGSQNAPVDTPAELAALAPYTAQTTIFSFGVGYANDEGNKALVTSVTFAGQKYNLTCAPPASPSPSTSGSANHSPTPTHSGAVTGPTSHGGSANEPTLPVTGSNTGVYVAGGAALVAGGLVLFFIGRRRRNAESKA